MRLASQVIARARRRMQPCDSALPGAPLRLLVPWMPICPGPPSNSWKTFDLALVASAYGPPASEGESARASSTKKVPRGVGVEGLPTTARKRRTARPELLTVTRRAESETRMRQSVSVARVPLAEIHHVWLLGRPGSRTRSQLSPRPPWPSSGRTVATRVNGRRADTASIAWAPAFGAARATWEWSRTTSGWAGEAAAGAAGASPQASAERARAAAAVATPRRLPRGRSRLPRELLIR
jgi:hypothetical protein